MNQTHHFTNSAVITLLLAIFILNISVHQIKFIAPVWSSDVSTQSQPDTIEEIVEEPKISTSNPIHENLKLVFVIGKEIGHPETLQAILMQESGGGVELVGNKKSPVGKRSYGVMQVQVVAAKSVLSRYPALADTYFPGRSVSSIADEEIIALLLTNKEANIRIAAHHFKLYLKLTQGNWSKAVAAYNTGIGGVENLINYSEYSYVTDITKKMNTIVKPFNKQNSLVLTQQF